jgi:glycosyltransferase involved in cell wall biosynthesis
VIVGFPHRAQTLGGPGSFQLRLTDAIDARGHTIVYPDDRVWPDVVLVVGGTARLGWLHACKSRGARIVHRLDGLNWRHRLMWGGWRHKIMSEIRNRLMIYVRDHLADSVVYQSKFVRDWWHERHGRARGAEHIIYNAVDLDMFRPGSDLRIGAPVMVAVEGTIQDDPITMGIVRHLAATLVASGEIAALRLYGQASPSARAFFAHLQGVEIHGSVPREQIPLRLRECDLFLNLEINPPCPNSVVEALASGLPVIGYNTGSLAELAGEAACLAPYGSDPWRLQQPSPDLLVAAAREALVALPALAKSARTEARQRFALPIMVDGYMSVLENKT